MLIYLMIYDFVKYGESCVLIGLIDYVVFVC